jgi:hypothetical protein
MWRCAVALLLACSVAGATTVERLDLPDLTSQADEVFLGTCQAAQAVEVDGRTCTRYTFRVDRVLKGVAQQQCELVLPGGSLNGVSMRIQGMPSFVPGEEAVLFLVGTRPGPVWPLGLGQGAFRVLRGGAARTARVVQQLDGLSLRPAGAAKPAVAAGGGTGVMELDELLAQVRSLLRTSSGGDSDAAR